MTHLEIQSQITQNLLLGLKKQSEAYLELISNTEYTHDQRKDFEKELSDINKVLNELSNKTVSYTVQELEQLKITFNEKLTELSTVISDLEINTLKIEFNSLTPEQKEFLRGEKGEKGNNGLSSYELAKLYGFEGNEIDYLNSLKGAKGDIGLTGAKGENGQDGISFTFDMFTAEQLESLKGENGKDFKYEDLTTQQKNELVSYFNNSSKIVALENSLQMQNENFSNHLQNYFIFLDEFNELKSRIEILENNQGTTTPATPSTPINEIDFKSEYTEFNSYLYQNRDLQLKPFYFIYNYSMAENDKMEVILKNGDLEYYVNMGVVIQPIYGDYQLQVLNTNLPTNIGVEAYYKINPNDSVFAFNLEFNDKDNNFNIIYPFNSFEIYIYRDMNTIRIDDLTITDDKAIFDSADTPPPVI